MSVKRDFNQTGSITTTNALLLTSSNSLYSPIDNKTWKRPERDLKET